MSMIDDFVSTSLTQRNGREIHNLLLTSFCRIVLPNNLKVQTLRTYLHSPLKKQEKLSYDTLLIYVIILT